MDGIETTKRFRPDHRHVDLPVVALIPDVVEDERDHCLSIGINDFATKPIDPQVLIATLGRWVKFPRQS